MKGGENIRKLIVAVMMVVLMEMNPINASTVFEEAKPIVVLVGKNYDSLRHLEGYQIISSNVNWFEPGVYQITYQKIGGAQTMVRNVSVLSHQDFTQKRHWRWDYYPEWHMDSHLERTILCAESFEKNGIVFAWSMYDPVDQERGADLFITLVRGGDVVWETKIRSESQDYLRTIKTDQGGIVGVGTSYGQATNQDGWIVRLSWDGDLIDEAHFRGNRRDFFNDIIVYDTNYVVVGKSNSNQGLFVNKRFPGEDYDGFVLRLDRNSLQPQSIRIYGSNGDDDFENVVYNRFDTIIALSTKGLQGDFADGIHAHRVGVVRIDAIGNVVSQRLSMFTPGLKNERLFLDSRGTVIRIHSFFSPGFQGTLVRIQEVDSNLLHTTIDEYIYPSGSVSMSFADALLTEDGGWITVNKIVKVEGGVAKNGIFLREFRPGFDVLEHSFFDLKKSILPVALMESDQVQLLVESGEAGTTSKPGMFGVSHMEVKHLGSIHVGMGGINVDDYEASINFRPMFHKTELSDTAINLRLFGFYPLLFVFNEPEFLVAFHKEVFVGDRINISSQQTYHRGIRLSFNGIGYLNDVRIEEYHTMNASGEYVLEVIGKDGIRKFIDFTIADLACNDPSHLIRNKKIEFLNVEIRTKAKTLGHPLVFRPLNDYSPNLIDLSQIDNWYFLIPALCSIVILYYAMKGARK